MLKIKLEKGVTNIKGKHNSKEVTNITSKQKKSDSRKHEQALLTLKNSSCLKCRQYTHANFVSIVPSILLLILIKSVCVFAPLFSALI